MKNNFLLLGVLLAATANAQDSKWRVSAEYGIMGLSAYHDYSIYHDREIGVGSTDKNEYSSSGLPAFAVSYQLNEVLGIGLTYMYEQFALAYSKSSNNQLNTFAFENKKRISHFVFADIQLNWGSW